MYCVSVNNKRKFFLLCYFLMDYYHSGTEIDMWSFACLLPELRTAVPAFAGEGELDQLAAIAEACIVSDTYIHADKLCIYALNLYIYIHTYIHECSCMHKYTQECLYRKYIYLLTYV